MKYRSYKDWLRSRKAVAELTREERLALRFFGASPHRRPNKTQVIQVRILQATAVIIAVAFIIILLKFG